MNTIEYERKQLLTLNEYNMLITKLNEIVCCNEVVQVNYYFDDNNYTLYDKGDTLRVRQKLGKLSLERKFNKRYSTNGVKICDESNEDIQSLPMKIVNDDNKFYYIGNLITVRKNYKVDDNTISLDVNYYLGEIDYEVEIESEKEVTIPEFVSKIIKFNKYQDGKYKRFVRKLKEKQLEYEI